MGPQAYGHCHAVPTQLSALGRLQEPSTAQRNEMGDRPAGGSVGRLFDLYNTTQYAVDKGLYYTQLHFEIGN